MLSSYLAERHRWKVTGIDSDPERIERARRDYGENQNSEFIEADATELPFGSGEFDVVLLLDALHHIPNWDEALSEISRVLEPKGFCVLHDLAFPKFSSFEGWSIAVDDISKHLRKR